MPTSIPCSRNTYHRPGDEKRMVVILSPGAYEDWLTGAHDIRDFLVPYPAELLA
ncbi:hypothetical protein BOSP111201_05560 [Bordetella sputigena]